MELEEKVLKKIGAKIKKLRIAAGYKSYESFAIANDLSRMHYWRMEKGELNITIKTLLKILKIHKITIEKFFSDLG